MIILKDSLSLDNETDIGVFWKSVYGIDHELEKLVRDMHGKTSNICFIDGYQI